MTQSTPTPAPGAARRTRRIRLTFVIVIWLLIGLQSAAGPAPLSHSPGAAGIGAFLGMMAAIQLQQLVTLALGRVGGIAPTMFFLGSGRWLAARRLGPLTLVLRTVPLIPLQAGQAIVAGPALRLRLLLGGVCRIGSVIALGVLLIMTGEFAVVFAGVGALFYAFLLLIGGPKKPGTLSWMIFRAPFADTLLLQSLARGRAEVRAERALLGARYAEAREALSADPLPVPLTPDRVVAARAWAAVEIGEGRYEDARRTLDAVRACGSGDQVPASELLLARTMLFSLEDGTTAREDALPAAQAAIASAQQRMPRLFAATEVLATLALLNGRGEDALALAREGLHRATDLQIRAHTLCTLAGAQAVTGDFPAARATLTEARALAPQLARIATVDRLLTELPLTGDRV